jgi:hypothetical protein
MGLLTMHSDFCAKVLSDNSLEQIVAHFIASGSDALFVDRHVLDVVGGVDSRLRDVAIAAAIELARAWDTDRRRLQPRGVFMSAPVAIVDDDWLTASSDLPTPPHVWISLARSRDALNTYGGFTDVRNASGYAGIDSQVVDGVRLARFDSSDPDVAGSWVIRVTSSWEASNAD